MSVKIRLSRIGKKHEPFYRVIAVDSRKKRDGAYLQNIGTFDATKTAVVCFDEAAYETRLSQGAIPSDAVKKIYAIYKKGAKAPVAAASTPKAAAKKASAAKKVQAEETASAE